jgi:hypothetical protein
MKKIFESFIDKDQEKMNFIIADNITRYFLGNPKTALSELKKLEGKSSVEIPNHGSDYNKQFEEMFSDFLDVINKYSK